MGSIGIYISPYSYVDIYSSRGTGASLGVSFGIHMQIDQFNMGYISWGDNDGFKNTESAGGALYWLWLTSPWFPVGISFHGRLCRA